MSYYASGQFNFTCDLCGGNFKSGTAEKTWDGFYVCQSHKEMRNPQDFVRGVAGEAPLPWSRPDPVEGFIVAVPVAPFPPAGTFLPPSTGLTPPSTGDFFAHSSFRILLENGSAMLQENLSLLLRT